MSPFRWDVLLVGLVLAVPVLALGMRGDLTTEEVVTRLPWCLAAGWGGGRAAAVRERAADPRPDGEARLVPRSPCPQFPRLTTRALEPACADRWCDPNRRYRSYR